MDNTLYEILETNRDASADDLKRSYKKLCVKHHPDKGGNEEHFKRVSEAYNILKDPEKRKMYDQHGLDGIRGGAGSAPDSDMMQAMMSDLFGRHGGGNPFGHFFGGGQPQQRNVMKGIRLRLEDIIMGNSNLLYPHSRKVVKANSTLIKCDVCKGKGSRAMQSQMGFMQVMQEVECPKCRGKCFRNLDECYETIDEVIRLEIPKDCQEGDRIILKRKLDEHPSQPIGDLVLQVEFEEHPVFKRIKGSHHLYVNIDISLYESLFGFQRSIRYLDGNEIHIHCQKNLNASRCIPFIPGKGLFDKKVNQRRHLFLLTKFCSESELDDILATAKFIPYILDKSLKEKHETDTSKKLTALSFYQISNEALFEGIIAEAFKHHGNTPNQEGGHHPQCSQQ